MATQLKLKIGERNGKSVITEQFFTSPLKLGTPNGTGERLRIILMMASAGILKGDSFCYDICCEKGTKTLLTEQSYSKIFDTGEGGAAKTQCITVEEKASLCYRPCAVIPFTGSTYDGDMTVYLKPEAEFAYADIVTAGRVGMGEQFGFRHYRNRIRIFETDASQKAQKRLVWLDHCLLEPDKMHLKGMTFFDGWTHQGTFYYYGSPEKEALLVNTPFIIEEADRVLCGISKAQKGICIRILAHTAQDIEEIFDKIEEKLLLTE